MKNIFLSFLIVFSVQTFAAISVVSDLDDTIKITQSDGRITDILGKSVFTGMTEFFRGIQQYTDKLYILSASPSFLRGHIISALKKNNIRYDALILRDNITEKKFSYKLRMIQKIIDSSVDNFIFLGDDLGVDPEIYAHVKKLYPQRILGIYIHVVKGRRLNQEVVPYWTSLDLFLREFEAQRMSPGWVEFILEKFTNLKDLRNVIPKKADCPIDGETWDWQLRTPYMQETFDIVEKITSFCKARRSDIIVF